MTPHIPDLILYNGKIHSLDSRYPDDLPETRAAMTIFNGKIVHGS